MSHARYMNRAFRERFEIVNEADGLLANVEFDTFVGIGISGTLVAPLLSDMGKGGHGFAIVRKEESTHSEHTIEGDLNSDSKYIFVDDFIDSGSTLEKVLDAIDNEWRYSYFQPKMVGAYLYQDHRFYTLSDLLQRFEDRYWINDGLISRLEKML